MIEEQYVSFETAKLLKKAGFKARCGSIVDDDGRKLYRPTQALAARWLREVYRIRVDATFNLTLYDEIAWRYFIGNMDKGVWADDFQPSERKYSTYEEAMEAGLRKAIEMIEMVNGNGEPEEDME